MVTPYIGTSHQNDRQKFNNSSPTIRRSSAAYSISTLIQEGNLYRELGTYHPAVDAYTKALTAVPGYYLAQHNLAVAYEEAGDRQKALDTYRAMFDAPKAGLPEKYEATDRSVLLYRQLRNPDAAEKMLNEFAANYADQAKESITQMRTGIQRTRTEMGQGAKAS